MCSCPIRPSVKQAGKIPPLLFRNVTAVGELVKSLERGKTIILHSAAAHPPPGSAYTEGWSDTCGHGQNSASISPFCFSEKATAERTRGEGVVRAWICKKIEGLLARGPSVSSPASDSSVLHACPCIFVCCLPFVHAAVLCSCARFGSRAVV
jgi:hypothetical protein